MSTEKDPSKGKRAPFPNSNSNNGGAPVGSTPQPEVGIPETGGSNSAKSTGPVRETVPLEGVVVEGVGATAAGDQVIDGEEVKTSSTTKTVAERRAAAREQNKAPEAPSATVPISRIESASTGMMSVSFSNEEVSLDVEQMKVQFGFFATALSLARSMDPSLSDLSLEEQYAAALRLVEMSSLARNIQEESDSRVSQKKAEQKMWERLFNLSSASPWARILAEPGIKEAYRKMLEDARVVHMANTIRSNNLTAEDIDKLSYIGKQLAEREFLNKSIQGRVAHAEQMNMIAQQAEKDKNAIAKSKGDLENISGFIDSLKDSVTGFVEDGLNALGEGTKGVLGAFIGDEGLVDLTVQRIVGTVRRFINTPEMVVPAGMFVAGVISAELLTSAELISVSLPGFNWYFGATTAGLSAILIALVNKFSGNDIDN